MRDPLARRHLEVVAALRADPVSLLELVVAVVRVALRARVRVALAVGRRRRLLGLDGDVDPLGHGLVDLRPGRVAGGYRPSAASRRVTGSTFLGSGRRPVTPAPAIRALAAKLRSSASTWSNVGPPGSGMNMLSSPGRNTSPSSAT